MSRYTLNLPRHLATCRGTVAKCDSYGKINLTRRMIRLVRLVGVEPFMTVSAGSAQNQSEKGNTLRSNRVFHSMPLDCDDTIRKSGNLTLIRQCAVKRRGTPVGESPTRQMLLRSVAIGAGT